MLGKPRWSQQIERPEKGRKICATVDEEGHITQNHMDG